MTRLIQFANNATSKLAANLSNVGTSITLTPGDGAKFPTLSGGQVFYGTLVKASGVKEVVKITARTSDTLTIGARAVEAVAGVQTAFSFIAGDSFELRMTAGSLSSELDRLDAAAFLDVSSKSANYTVVEADVCKLVKVDTTSGNITITLPQISTLVASFEIQICKNTGDANIVTVARVGADTINGLTSYILGAQYQCVWLVADLITNTWSAITSASASNVTVDPFVGAGTAGPFTLSGIPGSKNSTAVYVGGIHQDHSTYTLVTNQLTLGGAVGVGVSVQCVWSAPLSIGTPSDDTVSDVKVKADAAISGSKLAFLPAGTGAVATTVQTKLRESVSVKDFGAVGDGVTEDRTAIQAAFNSGAKQVYFPEGTYWLGSTATAINFIDLSALGENLAIVTDGFVEFVVETTASVIPNIFYLKNNSHFRSGAVRFKDLGYDPLITWKGARGFCLDNAGENWGDVIIDAVYAYNLVSPIGVTAQSIDAVNRIRGIKIGQLYADDCYQGFNAQNSGDGVVIDNLVARKTYRAYYVYGVTSHNVNVYARDTRLTSGNINISRSVGGLDTAGITVNYINRDTTTPNVAHVNINHIDLLGGTISNINVNVDIRSSVAYVPCKLVNYTGLGGSETSAASLNLVQDTTLSGTCDANATNVDLVASYASLQTLTFKRSPFFNPVSPFYTTFNLNQQKGNQSIANGDLVISTTGNGIDFSANTNAAGMTSERLRWYEEGGWTPQVTFGGGSTGITGSFVGRYTRIGREVFCHCTLSFTNKGSSTGNMTVGGLPFTSGSVSTFAVTAGVVANLASAFQLQSWINETATVITMQKGNLASTAAVSNTDILNNTRIDLSFNYMT